MLINYMVEYIYLHCHLLDWHQNGRADVLPQKVLQFCICVLRELKLRNYTPEDEELKERQVPKAKPASGKNYLIIKGIVNINSVYFMSV